MGCEYVVVGCVGDATRVGKRPEKSWQRHGKKRQKENKRGSAQEKIGVYRKQKHIITQRDRHDSAQSVRKGMAAFRKRKKKAWQHARKRGIQKKKQGKKA